MPKLMLVTKAAAVSIFFILASLEIILEKSSVFIDGDKSKRFKSRVTGLFWRSFWRFF
jgi:hypothetical protein